jgi:hypothetical protein
MALVDITTGHRMARAYSVGAKRRNKRALRGRPKHDVTAREPNGRASRATGRGATHEEPVREVVLRQRAKLGLQENQIADERAESALGVLCLLGRLADGATADERKAANDAAYGAGVWWREVVHGLHRIIGAPPPYPRSPAWEMVARGSIGDFVQDLSDIADPDLRAEAEAALIRRKQRFLGAYEQGRAAMGDDALAVEALVIHDRAEQIEQARRGLAALVRLRER